MADIGNYGFHIINVVSLRYYIELKCAYAIHVYLTSQGRPQDLGGGEGQEFFFRFGN